MLDSQKHNYILIYIYIYSGRWCFADQLHVSALYIGHHQVICSLMFSDYNIQARLYTGIVVCTLKPYQKICVTDTTTAL